MSIRDGLVLSPTGAVTLAATGRADLVSARPAATQKATAPSKGQAPNTSAIRGREEGATQAEGMAEAA